MGHHCVECVQQGSKNVRQARTAFGGGLAAKPYVTWTILGINLLLFAAQMLTNDQITYDLGMNVAAVGGSGQYYRLITSAFLHYGWLHIAFNSWALYMVGPLLERSLGYARFLALYLLSALGGSVLGYWLDAPNVLSVGASGAIFGLFGAVFVVGRKQNMDIRGVAMLIVLNLVITFLPGTGISWTAHVGGLITGAVVSAALVYAPKANRSLLQAVAIVVALAILVALVVVRTNTWMGG